MDGWASAGVKVKGAFKSNSAYMRGYRFVGWLFLDFARDTLTDVVRFFFFQREGGLGKQTLSFRERHIIVSGLAC